MVDIGEGKIIDYGFSEPDEAIYSLVCLDEGFSHWIKEHSEYQFSTLVLLGNHKYIVRVSIWKKTY